MADNELKIEVDVQQTIDRFSKQLPNMTRQQILAAMAQIVTAWGRGVDHNIQSMFTGGHSVDRPSHVHLRDAIVKSVEAQGDLVVGQVTYDLKEVPYARMLELGGVIPATDIRPRGAPYLKIPTATFKNALAGEADYDQEFVRAYGTPERGAFQFQGFHYIAIALSAIEKHLKGDLELAVARAVKQSDFTSGKQ